MQWELFSRKHGDGGWTCKSPKPMRIGTPNAGHGDSQMNTKVKAKAENKTHAEGVTKAEGTSAAKHSGTARKAEPTQSGFYIESEKISVPQALNSAIEETLPGHLEQVNALMEDLEALKTRFEGREGTRLELDDLNGADIQSFDSKHRQGRCGKMPNGLSTYKAIASYKNFPVAEKQLRRLHDRYKLIQKFAENGFEKVPLGVSHYDACKPLKNVATQHAALVDALNNNLSVAQLRVKYLPRKDGSTEKSWKDRFLSAAKKINIGLGEICKEMETAGETPDVAVLSMIDDIVFTLGCFTKQSQSVTEVA